MQLFALLLVALVASVASFKLNSRLNVPSLNQIASLRSLSSLSMAEEGDKFEPEFQPEDPKLFDMNRIVRLGRSRDQVLRTPFICR